MMHGHITSEGRIYWKHEREKDKLKMAGGSWTILLKELGEDVIVIKYVTDENIYTIGIIEAMRYGFTKNLGGEDKLVVPEKFWKKEPKEATI